MRFAYLIEPPFNFRSESGEVVGHDVALARHVFWELGEAFEPVETQFARLIPGLSARRWRMSTGLFVTEERRRSALFTRPVWALPDGLLVRRGNPLSLSGYRSIADHRTAVLAVIQDQVQQTSGVEFGIPEARLRIFDTYSEAAAAVLDGVADAYASVARAHAGFIAENPGLALESLTVPQSEKALAFGCFALALQDGVLCGRIDEILEEYLGGEGHREMAKGYGFSDAEVNLLMES